MRDGRTELELLWNFHESAVAKVKILLNKTEIKKKSNDINNKTDSLVVHDNFVPLRVFGSRRK